jgi:uncharacterized membrane protein (UPF0182 family)
VAMRPPMPSMILSRRAKIALGVVVGLIVLLIVLVKLSGIYINYLWFGTVGHRNVYSTMLWTKVSLFFIFGVLMALIIGGNLVIAYLIKPPFRPMSPEQANLQNYVLMVEPRRRLVLIVVSLIALLSAGASAQGKWLQWQLWLHGTSFHQKDPQFHRDISWYAWDYPVYRILLSFGFVAVIFTLILTVGVHYLTGAIRLQTPGPRVTIAARRQLTLLVFFFIAFKAIAYWLDRYALVFSSRSKFTGASYTDVHSELPAKTILFWIAVILALTVLASVWLRSSLIPGIGFITLIVLSILIGGIYPAIVQQVSVKPNASTKEAPYIKRNIVATRAAYGIRTQSTTDPSGSVNYVKYAATTDPNTSNLAADNTTVNNIRILDPNVISPTINNAQKLAQPYGFANKLNVDRYETPQHVTHDYVVAVRQLEPGNLTGSLNNWINQYTVYTHGYGFVAAQADTDVTNGRASDYAEGDIPPSGPLGLNIKQPDVYYGQGMNAYSVVGAQGKKREYDANQKNTTYSGTGGVSLSSPLTKLAFAVKYKETNFLLNDAVSSAGAKVIMNRDPAALVKKVAPFLTTDGAPYPFVDQATGHITWMVDAYTTMANYPYSQRQSLSALTGTSLRQDQKDTQINYIRNSVKATVDAYDGTVTLYQWDDTDSVLKSYMKIFPGLIKPGNMGSQMPTDVKEHVRYPQDLFNVQRALLAQYHITDPVASYNGKGRWAVPTDPAGGNANQPAYYVLANPPSESGNQAPQFQLTSDMVFPGSSATNLAAYITADSDPGPDYGKMTVLEVPGNSSVQGPGQVANVFHSEAQIAKDITQLNGSSTVIKGNLLTLPLGNSFMYVEPLYVQSDTTNSSTFPTLQRVLVIYGNHIGYDASLSAALSDIQLGITPGSTLNTGTTTTPPAGGTTTPSNSTSPSAPSSGSSVTPPTNGTTSSPQSVNTLLDEVNTAKTALNAAYDTHNAVTIARAQARYDVLANQLVAALNKSKSATPKPNSTPKSTPTPTSTKSGN